MIKNYTKLLLAVFFLSSIQLYSQGSAASDREALIALYNSTDGDNWTNSWDLSADMNTWYGITVNGSGRVISINMYQNNLTGTVPPEISNLTELTGLSLRAQNLTGTVLDKVTGLTKLSYLDFAFNNLEGTIPESISNLTSLKNFFLDYNEFSGEIPISLATLTNLERLNLGGNNLTGSVPNEIFENLSDLIELEIFNNDLTGLINPTVVNLPLLKSLNISANGFTGTFPSFITQLTTLETVSLSTNFFSGPIPQNISNLTELKNLYLSKNNFTGTIPIEITTLQLLERLNLSSNQFTGTLPTQIENLENLLQLQLYSNQFSGPLPTSVCNLANLSMLLLNDNDFTGSIPECYGNFSSIQRLELQKNNLTGILPESLENSTTLSSFNIQENNFVFEDLENLVLNIGQFRYYPQQDIEVSENVTLNENTTFTASIQATNSSNNTYQWRKNGNNIINETNSTLTISNITPEDGGYYDCLIENTNVPNLTLKRNVVSLTVTPSLNNDSDDDGITNENDNCPNTPTGQTVDENGCSQDQLDDDNDGVNNTNDNCPNTPTGETVDTNGCSQSELDDDNDGVTNNNDNCPNTPSGSTVDAQGCIISTTQINSLDNFSFEDWSGNPETPDSWDVLRANSFSKSTDATEGDYSIELNLNDEFLPFDATELEAYTTLRVETNSTITFDYKIEQGSNITGFLYVYSDYLGNFNVFVDSEAINLNNDGNWHTTLFDFTTNNEDVEYLISLSFRADTSPTNIIKIDNFKVLTDPVPDADNDGVADSDDLCPNTSSTAIAVDKNGCEAVITAANLLENPSFEFWTDNGFGNIIDWGRILTGPFGRQADSSDDLEYSIQLTTGNSDNICGVFQDEISLYEGITYQFSIDYKVISGTFNKIEFDLTDGIFNTIESLSTTTVGTGWSTFTVNYTPEDFFDLTLYIQAYSDLTDAEIIFDNSSIKAISKDNQILDSDNDGVNNIDDKCPNTPPGGTVDLNGCATTSGNDADNDGIDDLNDTCSNTPDGETVNSSGCSASQLDDDSDGVSNNIDQCPNTPIGNNVDAQGCPITIPGQINFLQNFSFEDWSDNPLAPDNWTINNANSINRNTEATDGSYSLELDLNNSLQFKTELLNQSTVQLAPNTTYTYAFDYKVERGTNVSANIEVTKDGSSFSPRIAQDFVPFNDDGNWHTASFEFETNDIDEEHFFKLLFRANTTITGIVSIDNMRVLGDALPDADNDGVLDSNDQCPNTSPNALVVDEAGCEVTIDGSNLIEDPSFEDWSYGGGANLAKWGIYIQLGSWVKNTDISDNLQYSVELITGGTSSNSIFQNELQFYKGVEYIISIDYKVLEGTFTTLQLELTDAGVFGEIVAEFTTTPSQSGWQTFSTTFTPTSNEMLDLGIRVESGQTGDRILLDNTVIRANVTAVGDDDNDGIPNTNDDCPNTPAGDTVDENGCTVTTVTDSDNDGVADADDDCPNTPTGDIVDENGCTVTTISDSDNDGVADADDDCPNTPNGDTVDANGCTVTTVTDSDNDGVADTNDDCPNTPAGETVGTNGCTIFENTLPDISNDGIKVKVTSTSCPATANGEISVSFNEDYNYTVQITGLLLDNTFDNINATNGIVRSDLSSGSYTVCITIPEYPSYEQCFNVTIETPEEFISGKTVIDYTAKKASVVVSGSKNYQVLVNDKVYSFEVDNIANQQLSFPLDKGANVISIETDKICQGVFTDNVVISNAILTPNPVADMLQVEGLNMITSAQIIISNVSGVTTLQESRQISNGTLEMNISNLSPGIYMLTIVGGDKEINLKFVKK
ncbi:putative secreted protein (Por secretion system target) [Maribacter spongiicola]|uniref:Putative secreted protein (Por secretion system target) n=1 Tax=Maribacter spongiicola TaxID=1206753 RepID=A0A4R7K8T9_9FLAO|nr:thrombospondin type 3 repeat-containing protein [Maribacter spongiicola]TDT46848.1 putative secreted protein (Por secretion system target) [Maribacter spongiicola]